MLASDVNLTPVSGRNKDRVSVAQECSRLLGNYEGSDPYEFNGERLHTITGRCLALNMSNDEDRARYADLAAACRSGDGSVELVWEEHVPTQTGGLFVYVCFTESDRIASKLIDK